MSESAMPSSEGPNPPRTPPPQLISDESDGEWREEAGGFIVVGRVVNWNHSPSFTDIAALIEPTVEVHPAQFLGVWHGRDKNVLTVIQVGNSFEVNPNEVPELSAARAALRLGKSYAREGVSTRIYRLAECVTVEEFSLREVDGSWRIDGDGRAPELLARASDLVVLLPPEVVIASIGGLSSETEGLHLGDTSGGTKVPVVLKPETLQFHIGVFGNPSKGKSYLSGAIIEEANAWGVPCLVLDINGEFRRSAVQLGGLVLTLPDPGNFGLSLNLMTPQELVAVTPNVQPGTIYAELIELAHDQLRGESRGGRITFDKLRERIAQLGESTKASKSSVGAALARVSTLEKDPLVGGDFDFIRQLEEHRIVVLDCRFLSLRQTQLIAAMGARELQRIGRERSRIVEKGEKGAAEADKWFALYVIDEAHAVIPNDAHVVSTQVHFELARMGRHVRTGLLLSSQSPADLDASVLKRLQTRFVFALERDQLRSIQGVLADLDERVVKQLPKLPRGVCAVSGSSDVIRHGFLLSVRTRRTHVGGSTPSVFSGREKRSEGAATPRYVDGSGDAA